MSLRCSQKNHLLAAVAWSITCVGCGPTPALESNEFELTARNEEALSAHGLYQPRMGAGVDFSETTTFRRCVTVPQAEPRKGFADRLYKEMAVRDRLELNNALGIDASFSAKGMWGSGNASASYFKDVNMTSENFYWLVHADYTLLDNSIDTGSPNFALTPAAKEILTGPRGLKGFYEACGEYFYSGNRLGAQYALLYEFRSTEEKTVERIKAAASYSGWGIEAKAEFEKVSQLAQKASALTVHAAGYGGGDRLRSYATNPQELETELKILRDDLYNHSLGIETSWYMSSYNMFPEVQMAKEQEGIVDARFDHLEKDRVLGTLYKMHAAAVDHQQRILGALKKASGDEPMRWYSVQHRSELKKMSSALGKRLIAIEKAAKQCLFDAPGGCSVDAFTDNDVWDDGDGDLLLTPDQDYSTLQGWTLHLTQIPGSKTHLRFVGSPPGKSKIVAFSTDFSLSDTPVGVMARADEGPDAATVIGWVTPIQDPDNGQTRPNVCIHNFKDVCSLRVVPLRHSELQSDAVKLQLVFFDQYGFPVHTTYYPIQL